MSAGRATRRATLAALLALLPLVPAHAQSRLPLPPIASVGFAPPAAARLSLGLALRDETGERVPLGRYLARTPAIVVPGYYACSNLCTSVIASLEAALAQSGLVAGRDVEVVAVSIDPREGPGDAVRRKAAAGPNAQAWHFLTGDASGVDALAAALGYRYAYDAGERQFAHAAGIAIVARDGRVLRTLGGVAFDATALHDAVLHATASSSAPALPAAPAGRWLLCFHYDPASGRYSGAALAAVRGVALGAVVALIALVLRFTAHARARRPA
jgi:protein SCO1/2